MKHSIYAVLFLSVAMGCAGHIRDYNGDVELRVVCIGDSNTNLLGERYDWIGWCTQLGELRPDMFITNRGLAATRVVEDGAADLQKALVQEPDVVIMAYGTNDLVRYEVDEIVAAYESLRVELAEMGAYGIVALTPPVLFKPAIDGVPFNQAVEQLNAALIEAFRSEWILDFHTPMLADDGSVDGSLYGDLVHMNTAGHAARAAAAARLLGD